jgi:hypothetical protein
MNCIFGEAERNSLEGEMKGLQKKGLNTKINMINIYKSIYRLSIPKGQYYKILGVEASATQKEIKEKYY